MKTLFYTLVLIAAFFSCRSVEKMVEKGEYERAFNYSISKLQGEKNKKTEYIKALEKAYFKLNSASAREIERLNAPAKPENWSKVLHLYQSMEDRQERLEPLLPLVSEDRYKATFDFKNYKNEISNAEENTCLYYYNNASELMEQTERTGDKVYAREAYDDLRKIDTYNRNYKDTDKLKERALKLGLNRIYVDIFNDLRDFQSNNIEQELRNLPVARLNDVWNEYSINFDKNNADYVLVIELNQTFFSPERERVNTYSESKEILVRKDKIKERRDSVDVWVEKEVYERVRADISEIFREKQSELRGRIKVLDTRTKEYIKIVPVNAFHNFNGYGCKYIGDERALTDATRKKIDNFCEIFPSDFDMAYDLAAVFKNVVIDEARKIKLR
ncbi:MAG: hypothetical protein IPJ13_29980 [Saprospiraceae bacterium]|nr:hypothetical protein [Saprospiraceae bacterium]